MGFLSISEAKLPSENPQEPCFGLFLAVTAEQEAPVFC
jgi:hypothetical protein